MSLEFHLNQTSPTTATVDCGVVVGVFADGTLAPAASVLDQRQCRAPAKPGCTRRCVRQDRQTTLLLTCRHRHRACWSLAGDASLACRST